MMMTNTQQSPLLEGNVSSGDDKLLALMKRLGVESLPAHETRYLSIERILVPGEALIARPSKRLVKSIQNVGILQAPSVVLHAGTSTDDPEALFAVVIGRRRVQAARLAGLSVIKCEVYERSTPQLSALLALIENEQRSAAWVKEVEDLHRLIDEGVGMTIDDLAAFGFDRASLRERLKIALLPEPVLDQVLAGKISQDVAKKIARLRESQQANLAQLALQGEVLTAERIKSLLRAQINTGLAPVQAALAQAGMPAPDLTVTPPATNGHLQEAPTPVMAPEQSAEVHTPSYAQVLATLHAFESQLATSPDLSRIRALTKALIQELQVMLREQHDHVLPKDERSNNHV